MPLCQDRAVSWGSCPFTLSGQAWEEVGSWVLGRAGNGEPRPVMSSIGGWGVWEAGYLSSGEWAWEDVSS